jgi:hypothetical protein
LSYDKAQILYDTFIHKLELPSIDKRIKELHSKFKELQERREAKLKVELPISSLWALSTDYRRIKYEVAMLLKKLDKEDVELAMESALFMYTEMKRNNECFSWLDIHLKTYSLFETYKRKRNEKDCGCDDTTPIVPCKKRRISESTDHTSSIPLSNSLLVDDTLLTNGIYSSDKVPAVSDTLLHTDND